MLVALRYFRVKFANRNLMLHIDKSSYYKYTNTIFYNFSVNAGCTALPILLNIKKVMQQQQVRNVWNNKEELPVCIVVVTRYYVQVFLKVLLQLIFFFGMKIIYYFKDLIGY